MTNHLITRMRQEAETIFKRSLRAVDPYEAVKRFVRLEKDRLFLGAESGSQISLDLKKFEHICLVGAGKATAPMARSMEDILNDRILKGIINVKYGFTDELARTEIIEAGHPVPDQNGVEGTRKILEILEHSGTSVRTTSCAPSPACGKNQAFREAGPHPESPCLWSHY